MAIVAITASSGVEEFYNRNHSKSNGRFSSGSGGSGSASGTGTSKTSSPGTARKVTVKNDWHNANHALNEKITPKIERKVATTVKAAKDLAAKYPDKQGGPTREKFGKTSKAEIRKITIANDKKYGTNVQGIVDSKAAPGKYKGPLTRRG